MSEYVNMTDDELITLAQSGDDEALETILVRYQPLVHKKSRPYYLAGGDDDDVIQEGLIGLYKAVISFDKDKFPLFKVFAGVCIERRILSAVKKAARLKHNPLNSYVSLSETEPAGNYEAVSAVLDLADNNPESIVIEREDYYGLEGRINSALSEFEFQVLLSLLNGSSYKETAERVGRDVKAVDNAMQRIKKKLETIVNKEGE